MNEDKTTQRIVSLLPSASEMICALGLGDRLVGVTHECDYPDELRSKPVVVRNILPVETMTQAEIDSAVAARISSGQSLYQIDERLLDQLAPDLIVTQDLCQVCAPSGNELSQALKELHKQPEILWMTPHTLAEIDQNILDLGSATGCAEAAEALVARGRATLARIAQTVATTDLRPRVFCMEWLDPVFASGHWLPEMVRIAGGVDALGHEGKESVRVTWADVVSCAPEVLIVTPCGFTLDKVIELVPSLFNSPGWSSLPAVQNNRVYAVDANSYFARPGPRTAEGTELLAHLIHPQLFDWTGPASAYQRIGVAI